MVTTSTTTQGQKEGEASGRAIVSKMSQADRQQLSRTAVCSGIPADRSYGFTDALQPIENWTTTAVCVCGGSKTSPTDFFRGIGSSAVVMADGRLSVGGSSLNKFAYGLQHLFQHAGPALGRSTGPIAKHFAGVMSHWRGVLKGRVTPTETPEMPIPVLALPSLEEVPYIPTSALEGRVLQYLNSTPLDLPDFTAPHAGRILVDPPGEFVETPDGLTDLSHSPTMVKVQITGDGRQTVLHLPRCFRLTVNSSDEVQPGQLLVGASVRRRFADMAAVEQFFGLAVAGWFRRAVFASLQRIDGDRRIVPQVYLGDLLADYVARGVPQYLDIAHLLRRRQFSNPVLAWTKRFDRSDAPERLAAGLRALDRSLPTLRHEYSEQDLMAALLNPQEPLVASRGLAVSVWSLAGRPEAKTMTYSAPEYDADLWSVRSQWEQRMAPAYTLPTSPVTRRQMARVLSRVSETAPAASIAHYVRSCCRRMNATLSEAQEYMIRTYVGRNDRAVLLTVLEQIG